MKKKCNICKLPARIVFVEQDKETKKTVKKSHIVECLGHEGIHPSLWNNHPNNHKYKNLAAKEKASK